MLHISLCEYPSCWPEGCRSQHFHRWRRCIEGSTSSFHLLLLHISHSLSPPFTSLPQIMLQLHFLYCVPVDIKNVYLQVKSVVLQLQRVATRGVALRPAASCCYHGNRRWMATGPPPLTVLTEEEEMMKESGVLRSCCCIQSFFSTTFKVFYL